IAGGGRWRSSREIGAIDLVHFTEVTHVGEIYSRRDNVGHAQAARCKHGGNVVKHPSCLFLNCGTRHRLFGIRIDRNLSSEVNRLAHPDRLRVRPDCTWDVWSRDDLFADVLCPDTTCQDTDY